MSITAKALIQAHYAANSDTTEYTTPANTKTIIDKFTATNNDSSARTINIHIIPNGQSVAGDYLVINAYSIAANSTKDFSELQNQILNAGEFISVAASVADKVVIRSSGREVS